MSAVFCCSSIIPYRPRRLDHEAKFETFMRWACLQTTPHAPVDSSLVSSAPYAIQLVRQINYGQQESIRYFVPTSNGSDFAEATEDDLLVSNFDKVNSYKNFKCAKHNKLFEVNLYQKNPTNAHHWRVNLARPSRDIDLAKRRMDPEEESIHKLEESAGKEEKQEVRSSDTQGMTSSPELRISLPQDLQRADEALPQKTQPENQPDITALKRVLRFLLPTVGTSLGTSRLLTLLSLDWANTELDLGLEFESLWKAELTSSNIALFLCECLTLCADPSAGVQVDLKELEALVIPAIRHVEWLSGQQLAGQVRLHEIVNSVLESGYTLDWVSTYGGRIARVFASGPGDLLDRRNDRLQQDKSLQRAEAALDTQSKKVSEQFTPRMLGGEHDDYDLGYDDHGFDDDYNDVDDDHEPMKDLTACDKECGYCGNCDY